MGLSLDYDRGNEVVEVVGFSVADNDDRVVNDHS